MRVMFTDIQLADINFIGNKKDNGINKTNL